MLGGIPEPGPEHTVCRQHGRQTLGKKNWNPRHNYSWRPPFLNTEAFKGSLKPSEFKLLLDSPEFIPGPAEETLKKLINKMVHVCLPDSYSCLWSIWSRRWKKQRGLRLQLKVLRYFIYLFIYREEKKILLYFFSFLILTFLSWSTQNYILLCYFKSTEKIFIAVLICYKQSTDRRNSDILFLNGKTNIMASGHISTGGKNTHTQ